jgi:hypothetical protein
VEKFNDWAVSERGKEHGMSWMPESVISLAAMEAARQNGERDQWWRDQEFPEWEFPEPLQKGRVAPQRAHQFLNGWEKLPVF